MDTGLFGLTAAVPPSVETHKHIVPILASHLVYMTEVITQEELARAKNQLKSNLLMSLEARGVELEDLGRQVLVHGKRTSVDVRFVLSLFPHVPFASSFF